MGRTNAAKLEAGHAEATSGLLVANGEVAALTGRLTLLEEEYWTIKVRPGFVYEFQNAADGTLAYLCMDFLRRFHVSRHINHHFDEPL